MNKWIIIFAAALMCAGCFDNKGKPEDVPTVIGLKALASTNRTGVVRVILRGDKGAITADMLSGLDSVKMIDLSERGTSAVQPEVLKLKGIKEFYFASNGMVSIPDLSGWAATLDYLNLDNNSIKEIPESLAKLTGLKWLRLNGNQIKEVPAEFINARGNHVTKACAAYLLPLIAGEAAPVYQNGLPQFIIL
jgi:Leucine-rich repeat (LRR) protein